MTGLAHRKGWCPGALRPMASGDGLIVRLRIVGGMVAPDLARALAACAENYGNGLIDLSSRANLQIRGVTQSTLPRLQARLDELGLLDADPDAEAVRNILAIPLRGVDPAALLDIRPLIQELDSRLASDRSLHGLPGKFLFVVDDGGALPLPRGKADIAFVARADKSNPSFAVHLGGRIAGSCTIEAMCDVAVRLAHVFIDMRGGEDRRMADLVGRIGAAPIAQAAGLAGISHDQVEDRPHPPLLGLRNLGRHRALGLGIPFGRLTANTLRSLADATAKVDGTLHLAPWRVIFIVAEQIDPALADQMSDAEFILDEAAPIRAVAACAGRPACLHGGTAAQADAERLAPFAKGLAASGIGLHVSGCIKGCAHAGAAPVTLIGRDGAYDLVIDGPPDDPPARRSLELASVEKLLLQLSKVPAMERTRLAEELICGVEK
jgi:precorrin-3B synthase